MNKPKFNTKSGNALLIAILLTSILILITLGLARLITSESRQIADLIRNGQAEYLAEGGSELGQLIFYSTESSYSGGQYDIELTINDLPATINFAVNTTTNHFPILAKEYFDGTLTKERKSLLFQKLLPGESAEIPLVDGTLDFEIEYYLPNLGDNLGNYEQADLNVLLYKLSGEKENLENTDGSETFAIDFLTAFLPAGGAKDCRINKIGKSADNPAKIVTGEPDQCFFNGGDFFDAYQPNAEEITIEFNESGEIIYPINEGPSDLTANSEFLSNHSRNLITLTNAINLNQIEINTSGFQNPEKVEAILGSLYYRICSPNCDTATNKNKTNGPDDDEKDLIAPYVTIDSTANFQNTTKNLTTQISRPNALSVFDFAIYRTASTPSEEE